MAAIKTITSTDLVGFDRLKVNAAPSNYPPHNILRYNDTSYSIELAVAGFSKDEIGVQVEHNILTITGEHKDRSEEESWEYLHRGLAARNFVVQFPLAEYMEVKGAEVKDGLLRVSLEYVLPESLKPRRIEIK